MSMLGPTLGAFLALLLLALAVVGLLFGQDQTRPSLLLGGLAAVLLVLSVRSWPGLRR